MFFSYLFIYYIFPPLILAIGLIGNAFGFGVLLKKELINIGPRDIYRYLFLFDSFYLLQIIGTNLQYTYNLDITVVSNLTCKLWNYFNYCLAPVSSWLVVYISIDRYVSIKYPAQRFAYRRQKTQLKFFLFAVVANMCLYIPVPLYYDLQYYTDNTTTLVVCNFVDLTSSLLISYLDLALRVILPFALMILLSFMLIWTICASRRRIVENFLAEENQTYYKEIRLAFSSILLNFIYILTQLPVSLTIFFSNYFSSSLYLFTYFLFYSCYSLDFYIILLANSLFRDKFIEFFKK